MVSPENTLEENKAVVLRFNHEVIERRAERAGAPPVRGKGFPTQKNDAVEGSLLSACVERTSGDSELSTPSRTPRPAHQSEANREIVPRF